MVNSIDVSVIIPTFRRECLVREAIESALSQQDISLQAIVLDDSPEGSARQVVEGLNDPRVNYVKQEIPSQGRPALVRNDGAKLAVGRYIHFLDDDDKLANGALCLLAGVLDCHPDAGVAAGLIEPFGPNEEAIEHERRYFREGAHVALHASNRWAMTASMLFGNTPFVNSACMIRRELVQTIGGYDPSIPLCEDAEFYMRAIRATGFVFVNVPVLHYRVDNPSLMHNSPEADAKIVTSYELIHRRYIREHGFVEFSLLKALARLHQSMGWVPWFFGRQASGENRSRY